MDLFIALALLVTPPHDPALSGGPERHEASIADDASAPQRPLQAGDRVELAPDFFAGRLAGGVERPLQRQGYGRLHHRAGLVIIQTDSAAPRSAGQAAAARGLPQR